MLSLRLLDQVALELMRELQRLLPEYQIRKTSDRCFLVQNTTRSSDNTIWIWTHPDGAVVELDPIDRKCLLLQDPELLDKLITLIRRVLE